MNCNDWVKSEEICDHWEKSKIDLKDSVFRLYCESELRNMRGNFIQYDIVRPIVKYVALDMDLSIQDEIKLLTSKMDIVTQNKKNEFVHLVESKTYPDTTMKSRCGVLHMAKKYGELHYNKLFTVAITAAGNNSDYCETHILSNVKRNGSNTWHSSTKLDPKRIYQFIQSLRESI